LENEEKVITTTNNANYLFYRHWRRFYWYISGGLAVVALLVVDYFLILSPPPLEKIIEFVVYHLLILLCFYLLHRNFDHGLRPLKFTGTGIEKPEPATSWKVPEMKKNGTFPVSFLPYSQIDRIETRFDRKGNIDSQYIQVKKDWGKYREIIAIRMHPPLAKEAMRALKKIVGLRQLVEWLNRAEVSLGELESISAPPGWREQALSSLRELLGEDVVNELFEKKKV